MSTQSLNNRLKAYLDKDMVFQREPYDWDNRKKWLELPFPVEEYHTRVERVRKQMDEEGLDCLLVYGGDGDLAANIRWISNYCNVGCDAIVVIPREGDLMVTTNSVYHSAPMHSFAHTAWIRDFRPAHLPSTVKEPKSIMLHVMDFIKERGLEKVRLGVEGAHIMPGHMMDEITSNFTDIEVVRTGICRETRAIKSPLEIKIMEKACEVTSAGLKAAIEHANIGVSEMEIASVIHCVLGADSDYLTHCMVVGGPRAGLKHVYPSHRKFEDGDMVYIDIGVNRQGYCTDASRTFCVGKVGDMQRRLLDCGLNMYESVVAAAKPGVMIKDLQRIAIEVADKAGLLEYHWPTGFGHGIGTSLVEAPSLHWQSETILKSGHVFALEPMVTISGLGCGVIEDVILITDDGARALTNTKRKLW
ncbi:Xaa-Pro peptidase family protein [Clostridiaceae bacterium M8S5]|nr:Xaa-Pro peptidase family protein [Clostridiaceae bacterium M8S5]